jgi:hypothetical protein
VGVVAELAAPIVVEVQGVREVQKIAAAQEVVRYSIVMADRSGLARQARDDASSAGEDPLGLRHYAPAGLPSEMGLALASPPLVECPRRSARVGSRLRSGL